MSYLEPPKLMTLDKETEITADVVKKFVERHQEELARYKKLMKMYKGYAEIYDLEKKAEHKPDVRLSVAIPRYMVDVFTGYFNGIPIKRSLPEDKTTEEKLQLFDKTNDMSDIDSELAKLSCIYGRAYELVYQDEETQTQVAFENPENMFIVYDDTIKNKKLFAMMYGLNEKGDLSGTLYLIDKQIRLSGKLDEIAFGDETVNPFIGLPATEYYLNEERIGLFETSISLIDEFNKALSEKANDVEYFSDSYMKILGALLDEDTIAKIGENRIINMAGEDADKIIVEFMDKPDSDQATENLLNRLELLIFKMSMVSDVSTEEFGNASGTALSYRLLSMSNLALTFQRKFTKSMNERYRLFMSLTTNVPQSDADDWKSINYTFKRNEPKNLKEEVETASLYSSFGSLEGALSMISVVDNAKNEIEAKHQEVKTLAGEYNDK